MLPLTLLNWLNIGCNMKLATFRLSGERCIGSLGKDGMVAVFDLPPAAADGGLLHLIDHQDAPLPGIRTTVALEAVTLEAPIPRPRRNIFCVGKNYHEHAKEFASSGFDSSAAAGVVPKDPIIFSKVPETVTATGQPVIVDPSVSPAVDYEVELAVIIGRSGRGIDKDAALSHVWGYTIVNDVTARDLQGKYSQWLIGKSQDTFCPMGPCAVTRDELNLDTDGLRSFINGELRQEARFSQLIFDVPTIIAALSEGITLQAGDVIATGTPAGVGIGFDPPRYLKAGDVMRMEIDAIGVLENRIEERA